MYGSKFRSFKFLIFIALRVLGTKKRLPPKWKPFVSLCTTGWPYAPAFRKQESHHQFVRINVIRYARLIAKLSERF